jgi:hypothetical protein
MMKKLMMAVVGLLFAECIFYPAIANASGKLLKTGQTSSYASYDDGASQTGMAFNYIDNTNGTVTDIVTGLMWAKDGIGAGCNGGVSLDWTNALNWAHGLTFASYSDWRLPNMTELYSVVLENIGQGAPYINKTFFPNTRSFSYWSSTTNTYDTTNAIYVYFTSGMASETYKTASYYVRAVRGGM